MKSILLFLSILTLTTLQCFSQDLTVPEDILKELHLVTVPGTTETESAFAFKVVYPENYDPEKTYPVLLGLSGGGQSEKIVDYCYAAWFRSSYFKNHLSIFPISPEGKNLRTYSGEEITALVAAINRQYKVTPNNWIIVGTSNGGVATFNFLANSPERYAGAIVIPGVLREEVEINEQWKHLKVLLAYGEKDDANWIEHTKTTEERLTNRVSKVSSMVLEGQGHILPIDFDIDQVYKVYFGF